MGIAEKPHTHNMEGAVEPEAAKKWVIAGIQFRSPLKPIFTSKELEKLDQEREQEEEDEEEEECSTTPTTRESRIPCLLTCPPAPRKRKPVSRSSYCNNGVKEFFNPPDLESIFIRRVERT